MKMKRFIWILFLFAVGCGKGSDSSGGSEDSSPKKPHGPPAADCKYMPEPGDDPKTIAQKFNRMRTKCGLTPEEAEALAEKL